jgi:hypothetical protein
MLQQCGWVTRFERRRVVDVAVRKSFGRLTPDQMPLLTSWVDRPGPKDVVTLVAIFLQIAAPA